VAGAGGRQRPVTNPPSSADARLRDLETAVARLSARLDALERGAVPSVADMQAADAVSVPAVATDAERLAPGWLGLVGRTCIVLGGAFLLRALTQSGQLPEAGGVWLGLAYAALWLALAGRAPGRSGFFHGLSALLVALPLVVEAALTFHVLSAASGAAILAAIAVASLGVAWRRHQGTLATLATLGTIAVTAALSFGLGTLLPSVLVLLVLLHLGVKNIHLGPTLPAFVSPNVLKVLVEKFNVQPTAGAEEDVKKMMAGT